jgi:hypothetical protein
MPKEALGISRFTLVAREKLKSEPAYKPGSVEDNHSSMAYVTASL